MKKFVALLAALLSLAALRFADGTAALALNFPGAKVTSYSRGAETVGGVVLFNANAASFTMALGAGESARILELLSARVINDYIVENVRVVEAYSPLLTRFVELPEGRVNVQIAIKQDCTLVGLPMIAGGY